MQKQRTTLKKNPKTYVSSMAEEIAHRVLIYGSRILCAGLVLGLRCMCGSVLLFCNVYSSIIVSHSPRDRDKTKIGMTS